MSELSPASILVDANGNPLPVADATAIPANTPALLIAGRDGSTARFALVDPLGQLITSPPGSISTLRGFSYGKRTYAAPGVVPAWWTTYTEQTSNAQRSIASSSTADTAAGTGARTVKLTYYSVTAGVITGPFTETVTLNGTAYVNTSSTTIAFIEKLEVMTVGSGGTNAGTLTLKAATAGGGATIVTIGIGDGQTFLGIHYVASGRTMKLTSVSVGIKGADGAGFFAKSRNPANANSYDLQITDTIRIGTGQATVQRSFGTPIEVAGPARVQLYLDADSSTSRVYHASMDYFED